MAEVSEVDAGGLDAGFSSAKKQILLTLKRRGAVSLSDMSEELRISKMATLKHLNVSRRRDSSSVRSRQAVVADRERSST